MSMQFVPHDHAKRRSTQGQALMRENAQLREQLEAQKSKFDTEMRDAVAAHAGEIASLQDEDDRLTVDLNRAKKKLLYESQMRLHWYTRYTAERDLVAAFALWHHQMMHGQAADEDLVMIGKAKTRYASDWAPDEFADCCSVCAEHQEEDEERDRDEEDS